MYTCLISLLPSRRSIFTALALMAASERSSGVFLSNASPEYEMNTDGMHSTEPMPRFNMNAGLDGSHAVYPRASNVDRMPPDGKLDASGSPCTSC